MDEKSAIDLLCEREREKSVIDLLWVFSSSSLYCEREKSAIDVWMRLVRMALHQCLYIYVQGWVVHLA